MIFRCVAIKILPYNNNIIGQSVAVKILPYNNNIIGQNFDSNTPEESSSKY